jgi:hypothetical protein
MRILSDLSLSVEEQVIFDDSQDIFISDLLLVALIGINDAPIEGPIAPPLDIILE